MGSRSVLLRIAELVFVEVLRSFDDGVGRRCQLVGWAAGPGRGPRAGATAQPTRPRLDAARLVHEAGASRSVLAERFTYFVGHPPMLYLTRWRMQLAASRLAAGAAPVSAIASEVGYESTQVGGLSSHWISAVRSSVLLEQ